MNSIAGGGAALGRSWVEGSGYPELVGGAGVPADPDPGYAGVGLGEQGDVGDEGAQQPFAVTRLGVGVVPEPGQVRGEGEQRVAFGQRRPGGSGGGQGGFGVGECGELGFPFAFQGAGDEPVFGFDVGEGAFGAVGVVAGASTASSAARWLRV